MKLGSLFLTTLAASPGLVSAFFPSSNLRRDDNTCNIKLASSNGGRKVAIVIDSSGSMSYNDPENLRITAGKALNGQLVSSSSGGKSADEVTVVDFDSYAAVIYPLGSPSGADSSFDTIDSSGGTWIADGVLKAQEELTKSGHGTTKDRSGIVVLTDGEDSDVDGLIDQINQAGSLGIRVSFGFLAPSESFFEPTLLEAILKTGGTYMSFDQAENIQPWLFLLLGNGITATDQGSSSEQPLLSGITIAKLSGSDDVKFSYAASSGEDLVFTLTSLSQQALDVELSHEDGSSIKKNATSETSVDPVELTYKTTKAETLELVVSAASGGDGVFQISVNSSLGISGCNINTPTPSKNNSATPTPTPSEIPPVTGGAERLASFGVSMALVALVLAFL